MKKKKNNIKKLKRMTLEKTRTIRKEKIEDFSSVVRNFFSSAFKINYQFTFQELRNILIEKKELSQIKEKIESFTELLLKAEYDQQISRKDLLELKKEFREIVKEIEIKKREKTKKRFEIKIKTVMKVFIMLVFIALILFTLENQKLIDLTDEIPFQNESWLTLFKNLTGYQLINGSLVRESNYSSQENMSNST